MGEYLYDHFSFGLVANTSFLPKQNLIAIGLFLNHQGTDHLAIIYDRKGNLVDVVHQNYERE